MIRVRPSSLLVSAFCYLATFFGLANAKGRFVAKFGTWRPNATWFAAASKFHDSDGGDRRGDENQRWAGGGYDHVEQAQQNRRVPTRD